MYFPMSFWETLGLLLFKALTKSSYFVSKKIVCPFFFNYYIFPLKYFLFGSSLPLNGAYLITPWSLTYYQTLTLSKVLTGVIRASLVRLAISEPEYLYYFINYPSVSPANSFIWSWVICKLFLFIAILIIANLPLISGSGM